MKKSYIKPSVEAYNVQNSAILEGSLNNEQGSGEQLSKEISVFDLPGVEGFTGDNSLLDLLDGNDLLKIGE